MLISDAQELVAKCASLTSSIKSSESSLEAKSSFLSDAMERLHLGCHVDSVTHVALTHCRCSKQERDIKQKRLLIEDYRRKQKEVNQILASKDDKIVRH